MIARAFYPSDLAVDASINQALCGFRVQQQMVDAKAGVAFPAVSLVIPERVHRRIRMHACGSHRSSPDREGAETTPEAPAAQARSWRRTWSDRCRRRSARR